MSIPTEQNSNNFVQAYYTNPKAFEALYDDGIFPPLSLNIMQRLRRGIGSFDEIVYYQQTQWGRDDLKEEEIGLKNSPAFNPKRGRRDKSNEDVPF